MHLWAEELKKMLRCRSSWIVMAVILAIQIAAVISGYQELKSKCGNVAEYNAYADQYNGTLDLDRVASDDIQKMQANIYQRQGDTKEDYFYERYLAAVCNSINYKTQYNDGNEPKYWNSEGINNLVQNLTTSVSVIFIFIGLLFGLHPVFSMDTENGMDKIIYSACYGRRHILKAKCIAGIIFAAGWVSVYYFSIALLTVIAFGNAGALGIPVNYIACLSSCPVSVSVWQYLLIAYVLLLVTSVFMTVCFMLIYARVKKIAAGLGAGLALIFFPMFVPKNGNIGSLFCILPSIFGNAALIVGENLKLECLGTEIPILGLGCVVLPVGTALLFLLLKNIFWNGRVEL